MAATPTAYRMPAALPQCSPGSTRPDTPAPEALYRCAPPLLVVTVSGVLALTCAVLIYNAARACEGLFIMNDARKDAHKIGAAVPWPQSEAEAAVETRGQVWLRIKTAAIQVGGSARRHNTLATTTCV